MFNASKIIVVITKIKIRAYAVKMGESILIEKREEFDWNAETIVEILHTIKKKFGDTMRILFSDEFVYVTTLKKENPQSLSRQSVQSLAQELIPEDMNKTSWDFRVYPPHHIQVAVLKKSIYDQITEAVNTVEIDIEAIESCSSSLARLLPLEKDPFILVFQDDLTTIITVQNGVALTSTTIHEVLSADHIEQAIRFSQEQFQIIIKKIIKTENIIDIFSSEFFKDFTIESKSLEPAIGLAMKTDIKTPDADSLNLEIASSSVKNNRRFSLLSSMLFFCAFIFTLSGIYFGQKYFMHKSSSQTVKQSILPTRIPSVSKTVTPSVVVKKNYTIRILNGSGVSGEASRLREALTKKNHTVISTDNAEEITSGISLHYNPIVDKLYLNDLDKLLKTIYTTVDTEPKLASDEADITIIIGTFTKKLP